MKPLVTGVDDPNSYFDPAAQAAAADVFARREFDAVVHLSVQAGVRRSIDHPDAYPESNLTGLRALAVLATRIKGFICRYRDWARPAQRPLPNACTAAS